MEIKLDKRVLIEILNNYYHGDVKIERFIDDNPSHKEVEIGYDNNFELILDVTENAWKRLDI